MTYTEESAGSKVEIVAAPDEIDIEQLMDEIRRNVAAKREAGVYVDDALPEWPGFLRPGDVPFSLDDHMTLLSATARPPLAGDPISSHRPWVGPWIVAAKKLVRMAVRKYTDGMFLRQAQFNDEAVATLKNLRCEVEMLRREVDELRAEAARPNDQ